MSERNRLIADVAESLTVCLREIGFRRRKGAIYTLDLPGDTLGWVGLNRRVYPSSGVVDINPVVGVRHQKLEQIVAKLSGRQFHQYVPPTVSCNVGYLLSEAKYRVWRFDESIDNSEAVRSLVATVAGVAVPFMRAHESYDSFIRDLRLGRFTHREAQMERLPVALVLAGQRDEAVADIERSVAEVGGREDAAAENFRNYARELLAWSRIGTG